MFRLAVVILTKNEESIIADVVAQAKQVLATVSGVDAELFLCDDSSDRTREIARDLGAKIIPGSGLGLGFSYYKMLEFLSKEANFDLVLTLDGDGQVDLGEVPLFFSALTDDVDVVVGSRFLDSDKIRYRYPTVNYFGVKVLAGIISLGTRQRMTDSHGGLRLFRGPVANDVRFLGGHSYVQETLIGAAERGFRIKEVPSVWNPRLFGDSRVVHSPVRYGLRMITPLMLRLSLHFLLGALFIICGLVLSKVWFLGLVAVVFLESYKRTLYKKNRKTINEQF